MGSGKIMLKSKTGQAVRGEYFFGRDYEINELWGKIESGSSILISAPRRVGKTSLMFYIEDNPRADYHVIYLITESVNGENEYFKRVFDKIVETALHGKNKVLRKAFTIAKDISTKIKSVGQNGIELNEDGKLNYFEELINLIKALDLEGNRLVIMVDEFAQTLENIVRTSGADKAVHFLQSNRELRQMTEINEKVQFIYAGSIGLENVVSGLNSVNLINDLDSMRLRPFSKEQARTLMRELLEDLKFSLNEKQVDYVLDKIKWYIPFYIQLVIQEMDVITSYNGNCKIDQALIDCAFEQILEHRNYFEHWDKRLKKAYKKGDYYFAKDLLSYVSKDGEINSGNIYNLAAKYNVEESFKDVLRSLVYDGYINNNENVKIYRFNSPILRMWWWKNVAN